MNKYFIYQIASVSGKDSNGEKFCSKNGEFFKLEVPFGLSVEERDAIIKADLLSEENFHSLYPNAELIEDYIIKSQGLFQEEDGEDDNAEHREYYERSR